MFGLLGGLAGGFLKAAGQTIAEGSDAIPNLKRLGLGMSELGDTLAAPSTPNRSTEAAVLNSERNGIISNWISGSGAEVQQTQVATVAEPGMGIPGSRSYNARVYQASPEYAARMASPFEADGVVAPTLGMSDQLLAQVRLMGAAGVTA